MCVYPFPLTFQAKDELNETDEKRVSAAKELRAIIKEKADEIGRASGRERG